MSDNNLPKTTPSLDRRQSPPRRDIIGGSVTDEERQRVVAAYEQARFKNISQGCRVVNLAFAESVEVRDAVGRWFAENQDRAA